MVWVADQHFRVSVGGDRALVRKGWVIDQSFRVFSCVDRALVQKGWGIVPAERD